MVLDLSYEQVAATIPQPSFSLTKQERIDLGLRAYFGIEQLAAANGLEMVDLIAPPPFICKSGLRYLGILSRSPLLQHGVAIDESGNVFDPDSTDRKRWSEYVFSSMLEFRPLDGHPSGT